MQKRLDELQSMIEGMSVGEGGRVGTGSSGSGASRAGGGQAQGDQEQAVLLYSPAPLPLVTMRGLEANYRSKRCPHLTPLGTDSKRFHEFLAVKFGSFDEAVQYTTALDGHCHDQMGHEVQVIHKSAKAQRPANIVRRGARLHGFYKVFQDCLKEGEELRPRHKQRGETQTTFFDVSAGEQPVVHELGSIKWTDDGTTCTATGLAKLHRDLSKGAAGEGRERRRFCQAGRSDSESSCSARLAGTLCDIASCTHAPFGGAGGAVCAWPEALLPFHGIQLLCLGVCTLVRGAGVGNAGK